MMSRRYQRGCLYREKRKSSPDVWVFRWRDGEHNRKEQIGTVEKFPTKSAAMKECELLRANINRETRVPRTFGELADHYCKHELPLKSPYYGEVSTGYLKTRILSEWERHSLSDVKAVSVEAWLKTLPLANGTKAKLRNLMHAIFQHAQRWEFFDSNPIHFVRQSAKRKRVPDVLTVEEIGKLLAELPEPWRTAVYVDVITGLRVSELLALKWCDMDFAAGEIHLCRGIVRQRVTEMKSEASRKPVPLEAGLADVLTRWREHCPYNQDADYIFASPEMDGKQPYCGQTPRWKTTSGPLRSVRESRSGWAGIRYAIRLELWSKAKARMLPQRKHCCDTLT